MEAHSEDSTSYSTTLTPRELAAMSVPTLGFVEIETGISRPSERYGHSSVTVDDSLLVFGGCETGGRFLDDLWSLELESARWTRLGPPLNVEGASPALWPQGRHFHGAVAIESTMFVLFGKSNGYMNDVWQYDVKTHVWCKAESTAGPSRRFGHATVEYGGDIYIYGGFDDFGLTCNDVWRYEVFANRWTAVLHLQSEAPDAMHHTAAVYQGSLLVWGGSDAADALYEFRFGSNIWSKVQVRSTQRPRPKFGSRCFVHEDDLYIVGGTDSLVCHASVWRFSMVSCEWTLLGQSDLWEPRYFFSLAMHGNNVVLFGGKNLSNFAFDCVHMWKFCATDTRPRSTYLNDFRALMHDAGPSDFSIVCRDSSLPLYGHCAVLFSRVPALREMESLEMDRSLGEALLYYIYTSLLPGGLSRTQRMELVSHAHSPLNLLVLQKRLELELVGDTTESNVVLTLVFCINCQKHGFKLAKLSNACVKLIMPTFAVYRQQLKLKLPEEYYTALKEIWRGK